MKRNPQIVKYKNSLSVNSKSTSEITFHDINENFVHFQMPVGGLFPWTKGTYYLYLMENEVEASKMRKGERGFPIFAPFLPMSMSFETNVLDQFWKHGDAHGVVGCIEYIYLNNKIQIKNMVVKKGYRRNNLNTLMLDLMVDDMNPALIDFGYVTKSGEKFLKSFANRYPNIEMICDDK